MKRAIQITTVLAMALVVAGAPSSVLAFDQTYEVRAVLPAATGFHCAFAKVTDPDPNDPNNDLVFDYNSGLTSFDFDQLNDDLVPGIFNRDFYIICDVDADGGAMGLYDVNLEYLAPNSPTGAVDDIGQKTVLSVSAVDSDPANLDPETLLTKTRLDMAPNANITGAELFINGVVHFARIAVGLAFGDDYSSGIPAGSECDFIPIPAGDPDLECPRPFTNGDVPGTYTADLKITVTPI